jgi:hypothetical protein
MIDEAVKASRPDVGSSRLHNLLIRYSSQKAVCLKNLHQDLRFCENLNGDADTSLLPTADALQKLVAN